MNTTATKSPAQEARETLKTLSQEVSDLVEAGTFHSVNDALMETLYKNGTHREFKSFRQWGKAGFQVRKGEKPFMLWARPKDLEHYNPVENTTEEGKYFPIAYVFSNAQVEPIEAANTESVEAAIPSHELEPLPYE